MRIGEVSKQTGFSRDTIRFYEKIGLLTVERTNSLFNNYKQYTFDHLHRLELIKRAKRFGFTLNEIAELLELIDARSASCLILEEKVNEKIVDLNNRIQELEEMKKTILKSIQKARTQCLVKREEENCKLFEV